MQFYDNGIGSPLGTRLIMYKENRWVGKANLDWQFDRYNRFKFGGELTRYEIGSYSHQLDDQIFSDVFLEKPIRYNLFAEDRLDLGDVVLVGGLRYDWYHTRAKRPAGFPVIVTHPEYDPNDPDAFFNNPDSVPGRREPRLSEPARPGLLPGDRADQLPALLRPPGAGA